MKNLKPTVFILLAFFFSFENYAQKKNRIQPGKIYATGEALYAPRYGFMAKVPAGWEGMLPRESEVFLLMTTTSTYGEIFVFGRDQGDLNTMREGWIKGYDLSETILLKALNPTITDGILSGEVVAAGDNINKGKKGFVVSKCNPSGPCITVLAVAPTQFFESVKGTVLEFMKGSTFEPPSRQSPYAEFDWKEFLSNKVVMTYTTMQGGTKENQIHLCADGTFTANIKKSGFFKEENPAYKGKLSGTWSVSGIGEETTIQFSFKKNSLSRLETKLTIKDEKVFSNGERYFVGQSDKCK
jgi:hypothetical protein